MRNNGIQSVRRAAAILKAFGPERPILGITELATAVGLPKSTAYRLAATLQAEGLLRQDPETGRYALGGTLHRLAGALAATEPLIHHGRPVLEALGRAVGHTVSLAVLDDGEAR
ncbi:MAG TPA: helix-turn-helix domain-containing protein, partial [Candidatus Binatia bacterium]|nr:helix-turn-helix domain-containing protein [Candidatus Binatia bacterium]